MIVEDERLLAELLASRLARQPGLRVVGCAGDGAAALPMASETRPDLILLDIGLPDVDGLSLIAPLREAVPKVKIIRFSSHVEPHAMCRAIEGNVQGYVEKPYPFAMLADAVKRVLEGGTFFSPGFIDAKRQLLESPDAYHKILSDREQEVLKLVVAGLSDEEIGSRCKISAHTVAAHRKSMRRKVEAHTDRELIAYARRWGLEIMATSRRRSSVVGSAHAPPIHKPCKGSGTARQAG
jgi:two-component system, NarL family, response regulator LiaR